MDPCSIDTKRWIILILHLKKIHGEPEWHKKDLLGIRSFTKEELKCMIETNKTEEQQQKGLLKRIKSYKNNWRGRLELELPEEIYHFFDVEEPYQTLAQFEHSKKDDYLWRWVILMYTIIQESHNTRMYIETIDDALLHLNGAGVETFTTEQLFRLILILHAYKDRLLIDFLIRELAHRLYPMTRAQLGEFTSASRTFVPQGIERLVPEESRKLNHIRRVLESGLGFRPELYNKAMLCLPHIDNVMTCQKHMPGNDYTYIIIEGELWNRRIETFIPTGLKKVSAVYCGAFFALIVKAGELYGRGNLCRTMTNDTFTKIELPPGETIISVGCGREHAVCATSGGLYGCGFNDDSFVNLQFPYGVVVAVACGINNTIVLTARGVLFIASEETKGEWSQLQTIDMTQFISLHTENDVGYWIVTPGGIIDFTIEESGEIEFYEIEETDGASSLALLNGDMMYVRQQKLHLWEDEKYIDIGLQNNVVACMRGERMKYFITTDGKMYSIESIKTGYASYLVKELQGVLPDFSTEKIKRKTNEELEGGEKKKKKLTQQCYRCQSTAMFKDVILRHAFCNEECYNEFYSMLL
jgi:hypothetical protein